MTAEEFLAAHAAEIGVPATSADESTAPLEVASLGELLAPAQRVADAA